MSATMPYLSSDMPFMIPSWHIRYKLSCQSAAMPSIEVDFEAVFCDCHEIEVFGGLCAGVVVFVGSWTPL